MSTEVGLRRLAWVKKLLVSVEFCIYTICHELTVLKNVIKRAFGELNNVFQDEFDKLYLNSQRMSDSFYNITESSELNKKNKVPKHYHLAMLVSHVLEFSRRNTQVQCFDP